jgi:hypothetical protein
MAGPDERQPPSEHPAAQIPQLIEKYRVQREAWMAQADELARLRDEVRGSAEREAMEIVTAARRDIRQIVMEARRELFVLSAQVQAALGEGSPAPQIGPPSLAHDDDRSSVEDDLTRFAQEEWGFAPRSTVAAVLEEARHDIEVLDKDARAVPARTPPPPAVEEPRQEVAPLQEATRATPLFAPAVAAVATRDASSVRWFAGVFVAIAIGIVAVTVWMLRGPGASTDPEPAAAERATAPAPASTGTPAAVTPPGPPVAVTVSIEAIRPAWIRAVVDGRGSEAGQMLQAGQTYEFSGRSIALRVGDAGAVRVSVNGGDAEPLGRDGQVVNRQYSLEGAPSAAPVAPSAAPELTVDPLGATEPPPIPPGIATTSTEPQDPPAGPAAIIPSEPAPAAVAATSGIDVPPSPAPTLERTSAADPATPSPDAALVAAAARWLDAYHRQDQVMLAVLSTPDVVVADERPTGERMPPAAGAIARSLDRVSVRVAADTAVLTGVMIERAVSGGLERASPVSLVWVASGGSWRLSQARLVSQSTLGQIFR